MAITDRCKCCGTKFKIDDAAISECKKKNNWEYHCPGCYTYIDLQKYYQDYLDYVVNPHQNEDKSIYGLSKPKTEYKVVCNHVYNDKETEAKNLEYQLNSLAKLGWRMISITNNVIIFERDKN